MDQKELLDSVVLLARCHIEKLSMQVVRAVVHGCVKLVKTESSEDEVSLDPDLAVILLDWIRRTEDEARRETEDNMIEMIEFTCSSSAQSPVVTCSHCDGSAIDVARR